jgi:hypothetical protein
MRTSAAFPDDSWLETQFTCFDEEKPDRESDSRWHTYIGNVHQVPHGPEGGLWAWGVTATFAGPRCPFTTSGREHTRKEAGRQGMETYERMLRFYGRV